MDREFIYRLADIFPGPLRTAARWVADRIFGVWDDLGGVFRLLRPAWNALYAGTFQMIWYLASWVIESANTMRWLVTQRIPEVRNWIISTLSTWVSGHINTLIDWVTGWLSTLEDWTVRAIDRVTGFLVEVRDWAWARIQETWGVLNWVYDRVDALLTAPERLARWLLGSLITLFLEWLDANLERVMDALWSKRQVVILRSLGLIERLIGRIL